MTTQSSRTSLSTLLLILSLILIGCAARQPHGYEKTISLGGRFSITYLQGASEYAGKYKLKVNDKTLYVSHDTSLPAYQSLYLLENTRIHPGEFVLDLGTGCGIQAIFAALNGARVIATDINPAAVNDTLFNAEVNGLQNNIEARAGDLFSVLRPDEKFDVIIANLNYPYRNAPASDWLLHERFFAEAGRYLKPQGRIYYESGWFENIAIVAQMAARNDLVFSHYVYFADMPYDTPPIVYTIHHRDTLFTDQHH